MIPSADLLSIGLAGVVALCAGYHATTAGYPATGSLAMCVGLLVCGWAFIKLAVGSV